MVKEHKFLIIAGEASGDRHAAHLVTEIKKELPYAQFSGIGGEKMATQGVQLLYHIKDMGLLGFFEVLRHLPFILRVFSALEKWLKREKPTAVILVDYPGFNLKLAKIAHHLQIPVIYYICPQLWAWGLNRIKKIRKYIDLPLVIFNFEKEFYRKYNIDAQFIGHPLLDQIHIDMSEEEFRKKHGIHSQKQIIVLLPGSRNNEVKKILPIMVDTILTIKNNHDLEWIVAKSPTVSKDLYEQLLQDASFIKIMDVDLYPLIKYSKIGLVASGTATLEAGYLGTPMIVLYIVSPLTFLIAKFLVKIKNIALVNIVLGKTVVPEFLQKQANSINIKREIDRYLTDEHYYQFIKNELKKIPKILGDPGTARRAALMIIEYLKLES